MHLFCDAWRHFLDLFERFDNQVVQAWSKRGWISALHKSLCKEVSRNDFVNVETSVMNLLKSITFKAIDSPERLWSRIHPRYFTFTYCLISVPLYTMFKVLAFQKLCLVPNKIDFALSWPKCWLNLLSTNQSCKLEKSLNSCFSVSVTILCWKTMKSIIKVMNHWQKLGASHLCKAKS